MKNISKIQGLSFIAPIKHLADAEYHSDFSMVLTHLVHSNSDYRDFYRNSKKPILLDNSFFELGECLSIDAVLEAAKMIKADCIVATDGNFDGIEPIKSKGYEVMFVPLSYADFVAAYKNPDIDKVGVSCLTSQKVLGGAPFSPMRAEIVERLSKDVCSIKILQKTHFLGATNANLADLKKAVDLKLVSSMDTSLPIWAGLNGVVTSATTPRLVEHCDFYSELDWQIECDQNIIAYKQCFNFGHLQLDWSFR